MQAMDRSHRRGDRDGQRAMDERRLRHRRRKQRQRAEREQALEGKPETEQPGDRDQERGEP